MTAKRDDFWALIPAAGASVRFRAAGYSAPKPLLQIRHPTLGTQKMLGHVVDSIPSELPRLVALPAPYESVARELGCANLGVSKSLGQGHTIAQMCRWLPRDKAILVVNCDVVFAEEDLRRLVSLVRTTVGGPGYDMAIATRLSLEPCYSYVSHFPVPTSFHEKDPQPCGHAMSGAWAFSSARELERAYLQAKGEFLAIREIYLSHAMNFYRGSRLAVLLPEPIDFGTPEAVAACGAEVVR